MPKTRPPQAKATRIRSAGCALPVRDPPAGTDDFLIVGIGASAGGLDACRKLIEALPASNGMAFILVQHLDPIHKSMMVDLLTGHTRMTCVNRIKARIGWAHLVERSILPSKHLSRR
jgi:two-component system, chemotaxis family, CheB/CheR fusion protein